jgi:hypothetical protein
MKRTFGLLTGESCARMVLRTHQTPTRMCAVSVDRAITIVARRLVGARCILRIGPQQSRSPRFRGRVTRSSAESPCAGWLRPPDAFVSLPMRSATGSSFGKSSNHRRRAASEGTGRR